jgi:SpoVK/Ycf46/Vps4 family AAA+-type ATPase
MNLKPPTPTPTPTPTPIPINEQNNDVEQNNDIEQSDSNYTNYLYGEYSNLDYYKSKQIESLTNSNCILMNNIYTLSETTKKTIDNLSTLNKVLSNDNYKLKRENVILKREYGELKTDFEICKRKNEDLTKSANKKSKKDSGTETLIDLIDITENEANEQNQLNPYEIIKYEENEKSWTNEQINDFLNSLNSLNGILNLRDKWYEIRHNSTMQKLYNIIEPTQELYNMIGLEKVKMDIFKIIIYYIQNKHTDEYLHTVISGPPGVGKTELAKIYSKFFVRLNILKNNKFIIIKKNDLVAKYLGQTSHQTKKLLDEALGGVIFLDEGYSLGNEEKKDSFAKEAIDMINQYLSEHKNNLMFVIAGYEEDLETCFFAFNRGLKRRFNHWIKISEYNKNELIEIFKLKVNVNGYSLDSTTLSDKLLNKFFDSNYKKFEHYAGDIEKFINYIKYEQSYRTFKNQILLNSSEYKNIVMDDLINSIAKFQISNEWIPPIGLYI